MIGRGQERTSCIGRTVYHMMFSFFVLEERKRRDLQCWNNNISMRVIGLLQTVNIYSYIYIYIYIYIYTYSIYIYIYIYIYILNGHFIRHTLLVPVGPNFAFRTVLILRGIDSTRFWKLYSEILVYIDMIASRSCCRFVGCTSMMRISRSTTSQRCSIGLRSGDCGNHLSKVNSLSCSRNQSEIIWALWHGALSCWK